MKKCLICTATYNRLDMTKQCFDSLFATASPSLYSLFVIDNGSKDGTVDYLRGLNHPAIEDIVYLDENVGTARALNIGWKVAFEKGQFAGKLDNDVTFYDNGWLSKMVTALETVEDLGLVGLKRRDLEEKPNHNVGMFRSTLFAFASDRIIEVVNHVMGTCWLVPPRTLEKVGALVQPTIYGLDDALYCSRIHLAGMQTAFIPDVAIEHIDPGEPKYPQYTRWKLDHVKDVLESGEYDRICDEYRSGRRSYYEAFA